MPTIELHGFSDNAADELVGRARELLEQVPYREDVVFDRPRSGGQVTNWAGADQPFLRVHSRSQEKLDELRSLLVALADVETLLIGYFPRTSE